MTNMINEIRLHVHWGMKWISVFGAVLSLWLAYQKWQEDSILFGLILLSYSLLAVWVFFLADSKIDIDPNGIQIIAPHGIYAMKWEEVIFVEKNKYSTYFFSEEKAIGYNLLLAGKGKRKFIKYVDQVINKWQFKSGRPAGVTGTQLQKLIKKSKVGKGKFY